MTIIVCDRNVMAADTLMATDGIIDIRPKLFRGPDDSILGIAGTLVHALAIVDFICGRIDAAPDDISEGHVLQLRRDGIWYYEGTCRAFRLEAPFYATGHGAPIALGAMHMGASPEEAAKIAVKVDMYCGGKIQTMALADEGTKRRVRKPAKPGDNVE